MTGTPNQIQMADQIRDLVNAEFARVALAFETVALTQHGEVRAETLSILEILARKRAEVLANDRAGYFITTWRELSDQVRQLIFADPAYKTIQLRRAQRLLTTNLLTRNLLTRNPEVSPSPASA